MKNELMSVDWEKDSLAIACMGRKFICAAVEDKENYIMTNKLSDILFYREELKDRIFDYIDNKFDERNLDRTNEDDFFKIVSDDKLLSILLTKDPLMSELDFTKEKIEKIRPVAKLLGNLYTGSGDDFRDTEIISIPNKVIVNVGDEFVSVDKDDCISSLIVKENDTGISTLLGVGQHARFVAVGQNLFECLATLSDKLLEIQKNEEIPGSDVEFLNQGNRNEQEDAYYDIRSLVRIGLGDEFSKLRTSRHGADVREF